VPQDTTSGTVTMDLARAQLTEEAGVSTAAVPSDKRRNTTWAKRPGRFTLTVPTLALVNPQSDT
jgi:hypothetical protein